MTATSVLPTATLRNATGTTGVVRAEAAKAVKYEGATLAPVTQPGDEQARALKVAPKSRGIHGSNFRETGIADGFIITRIDKNKVTKPAGRANVP